MVALAEGVVFTPTAEGGVMLGLRSGQYWQLNPTGVQVLQALLQGSSVSDIAADIVAECEVSMQEAESDVESMLKEMKSRGLIQIDQS